MLRAQDAWEVVEKRYDVPKDEANFTQVQNNLLKNSRKRDKQALYLKDSRKKGKKALYLKGSKKKDKKALFVKGSRRRDKKALYLVHLGLDKDGFEKVANLTMAK